MQYIDKGDDLKGIKYFQDQQHPVAQLLASVIVKLLPKYTVAVSKEDSPTTDFRYASVCYSIRLNRLLHSC